MRRKMQWKHIIQEKKPTIRTMQKYRQRPQRKSDFELNHRELIFVKYETVIIYLFVFNNLSTALGQHCAK